jgi:hypothetical protein
LFGGGEARGEIAGKNKCYEKETRMRMKSAVSEVGTCTTAWLV